MPKKSQSSSTKTAPAPGNGPIQEGANFLGLDTVMIRPGVLGFDPKHEAPSVPSVPEKVNAKAFDITPAEKGSGRG